MLTSPPLRGGLDTVPAVPTVPPTAPTTTLDPRVPRWISTAQLVGLWLIATVGAIAAFRAYDGVVFDDARANA